jgi:hypothetical protein
MQIAFHPRHYGEPDRFLAREVFENGTLSQTKRPSNIASGDQRRAALRRKGKHDRNDLGLPRFGREADSGLLHFCRRSK